MKIPDGHLIQTVNSIYEHYADNQEVGNRPHLGASIIGRACEREVWYRFRWVYSKPWIGRMLRLVETGKIEEARFVANLRAIGVDIREFDEFGNQLRVSFLGGHFGGSMDAEAIGFPEAPRTMHVVEFKTHNDKSFKKLEENGVRISKPEHYAQMQVYMKGRGLTRAAYMALNKNDDQLYFERIEYDPLQFDHLMKKAERVVFNEKPPAKISKNPTYWDFATSSGCKYCDMKEVCHEEKLPEVNCRTCLHATAEQNGTWTCRKHACVLTVEAQRIGCQGHLFMPSLINSEPKQYGHTFVVYADGRRNLEGGAVV